MLSEYEEQKAVIAWASKYHWHKLLWSTPNEARRSYALANRLKCSGMRKGVLDLTLARFSFDRRYGALYIEMKTSKGKVSEEQQYYIDALTGEGYLALVCRSHTHAINTIKSYLNI